MSSMPTPFATFQAIWNRLDPMSSASTLEPTADRAATPSIRPRVDIHESDTEFVIEADLPGVSKDNLQVEVEKNQLTISATRDREERKHEAIHVERYSKATLVRSFTLGTDVNAEGIRAELQDGVLTLTLPKAEKALPRRIEVR
jgi:HSP20 family protein